MAWRKGSVAGSSLTVVATYCSACNGHNYLIENTHDMPGPMDFEDNVDDENEGEGEDHDMDNEGRPNSPQARQKRTRNYSDTDQLEAGKYQKAIKAKDSQGKPKPDDWEPKV